MSGFFRWDAQKTLGTFGGQRARIVKQLVAKQPREPAFFNGNRRSQNLIRLGHSPSLPKA